MNRPNISNIELVKAGKQKTTIDSGFAAGFPPYLRGISPTMYTIHPWKNKTLSDFPQDTIIIDEKKIIDKLQKGIAVLKKKNTNTSKIVFCFNLTGNHFKDIATLRASRVLWAKVTKELFGQKNMLKMVIHVEILKTTELAETIDALSAIFGGVQSLNVSEKLNSYLLNETFISKTIDPWAGSYKLEELTHKMISETWELLQEKM